MEKASARLSVYMTPSEREAVQAKATAAFCSEAYVIRMLIRTYLPEYERVVVERANGVRTITP